MTFVRRFRENRHPPPGQDNRPVAARLALRPDFYKSLRLARGQMAEWLKAHAWKVCNG